MVKHNHSNLDHNHHTWREGPRDVCGWTACVLFSIIAYTIHPIAWGSSFSALLHHIVYSESVLFLHIDMFCNCLTLCVFLPKLSLYCQYTVICAALNFFVHREKRNTEWEHVLQVTLPCCFMALTATHM